jgi:hypothetical protein
MEEKEIKPENQNADTEQKPLDLPRIENPMVQFDKEKKMFWIGLPLDKFVNPLDIILLMDGLKTDIVKCFIITIQNNSKIIKPNEGNPIKNLLRKLKNA